MRRFLLTAGLLVLLGRSFLAQNAGPVPAPPEVVLKFGTDGDQYRFHLGELIPVKYSYVAESPGKYILVSQNKKLEAGHGFEVACSPPAEPVRRSALPTDDDINFGKMLNPPCGGVGVGGGGGSGCGDCDSEYPLSATPVSFGPVPLNSYLRFRTPGKYTCIASSADVTTVPRDEKIRTPLLVKSNPIDLSIVDDPGWAHSGAMAYADAYEKLCRGDDVPKRHFLQCSDIAARISYLDTSESLAAEARFFDGKNHGWDNGFWNAIQSTSHPSNALRLMTGRMQDPDVLVSVTLVECLAKWDLRIESPDAFQSALPATYHAQAVEKLRTYVRLLGSSLAKKDPTVLAESAKTYQALAARKDCDNKSLIPEEEQVQVLAAAEIKP